MQPTLTYPVLHVSMNTKRQAWVRTASTLRMLVSVLFGMLLLAAAASAQVETGQIAGTVTDESGAVVPNAIVTVKNLGTSAQRSASRWAGRSRGTSYFCLG